MLQHEGPVLRKRAGAAIVLTGVRHTLCLGVLLLGVAMLTTTARVSTVSAARAQQALPAESLVVVESFLAARNARDVFGATGWCAPLLALQDIDGQWFIDEPSMRYWLHQLTDKYLVDTLSGPVANGNMVIWTERLTPRAVQPADPWSKIMTVEVSAVIREGTIASLSARYPPLPLRPPPGGAPRESTGPAASDSMPTVAPVTLFVGSALGLALMAFVVVFAPSMVRAVRQHGLPPSSGQK
jgi:hypothetical protein